MTTHEVTIEEAKEQFENCLENMKRSREHPSSAELKERRQREAAEWAAIYLALKTLEG
jgi:hypothetical protein